mmetsp:Transcript_37805/g.121575  ORF Transcript_37805/g.121575 Transcript_37805/m.121575 type:complete len:169 (+) Transcript_37805:237-743(+)
MHQRTLRSHKERLVCLPHARGLAGAKSALTCTIHSLKCPLSAAPGSSASPSSPRTSRRRLTCTEEPCRLQVDSLWSSSLVHGVFVWRSALARSFGNITPTSALTPRLLDLHTRGGELAYRRLDGSGTPPGVAIDLAPNLLLNAQAGGLAPQSLNAQRLHVANFSSSLP